MFSFKRDGKVVYSHLSFLPEEARIKIDAIHSKAKSYKKLGYGLGIYFSFELWNRVSAFKSQKIYFKGIGVLALIYLSGQFGKNLYWNLMGNEKLIHEEIRKYPFPFYLKPSKVPDLSRAYFYLDEDCGYLANPLYHGK